MRLWSSLRCVLIDSSCDSSSASVVAIALSTQMCAMHCESAPDRMLLMTQVRQITNWRLEETDASRDCHGFEA